MPMPEENPRTPVNDVEAMAKELEIELMQKRAVWQRAGASRGLWRALSVLFLIIVFLGALLAYFFFVPGLVQREGERPPTEAKSEDR